MVKNIKNYYVLIISMLLFSCNNSDVSGGADVDKSLAALKENQKTILRKLEAIEKNQAGLKTAIAAIKAPAAPNNKKQQPKADPNKVYDIAIGDSYVMGNKDAPITIIEWTDFQ